MSKKRPPIHPYVAYEGSPVWKVISKAIKELVENGDLSEGTPHTHVVGYICKLVSGANEPKAKS